ncbi:MAG TPA: dephospho-CoA kinase, partial [Candidatus Sumerlaeota bacterium]|nr:dephospho-CoA kinase [Candidatus Sumerlaeota bacterium]
MILGLTGSLGSGKTTVSNIFRARGVPVVDADEISHAVTKPGAEGFAGIIHVFGKEYQTSSGALDRKKIAAKVFSDPEALEKLEDIVHPLVLREQKILLDKHRDKPLVVVSIPLMFEKNLDQDMDAILVVTISEEERNRRLLKDRGMTQEDIQRRLDFQMPQKTKVRKADYVIDNSGSIEETRRKVHELMNILISKEQHMPRKKTTEGTPGENREEPMIENTEKVKTTRRR